ncbi:hypothetical protein YTCETSXE_CDS0036 [Staphylococcus phage MVC_VPHSA2]|uniref:Uncharacterized protein n=1 Tax=Staphylococcus phage MVC_VPHSA1 TaxID=3088876 RepID=A0ABZ0QZI0_9CAUD|nr:hypothetical protein FBHYGVHD_CDS0097 [Staphylococcus phage MVC_VPHSA1]WPF64992.1 hypothetical protein YTCETSXE_CDS0036 [Staphylococcus phage MVC_VPHSA2]
MREQILDCLNAVDEMQKKVVFQSSNWWYLEGSKDAYNNMLDELEENK